MAVMNFIRGHCVATCSPIDAYHLALSECCKVFNSDKMFVNEQKFFESWFTMMLNERHFSMCDSNFDVIVEQFVVGDDRVFNDPVNFDQVSWEDLNG